MTDTTDTTAPAAPEPTIFDLAADLDLADLFGKGLQAVGHLLGTATEAVIEHEKAQCKHIAQLEAGLKEKEGEILDLLADLEEARELLRTIVGSPNLATEAVVEGLNPRILALLNKLGQP